MKEGIRKQRSGDSIIPKFVISERILFIIIFLWSGRTGKTTLMKKCIDLCIEGKMNFIHLDVREINAHPSSFMEALYAKLQFRPFENVITHLDKLNNRHVLFIDTFEKLAPIDDWVRQSFLPQLPTHFSTVIFGRNAPSISWTIDPGWKKYLYSRQVRNLSPDDRILSCIDEMCPGQLFLLSGNLHMVIL